MLKWMLLWCLWVPTLCWGQSLQPLGNLDYNTAVSDVWGYATDGHEYALVGLFNGFSLVDVTDPTQPTEVFFTPGPSTAWRDCFAWQDRAYVISEGGDGLLIVDLSPLPDGPITTWNYYTGVTRPFQTGHNLFVADDVLFLFGTDVSRGGVLTYDVTDPDNPVELGIWDQFYVHDGTVRGDTLWASLIDEGEQAVIDVSDPTNMILKATWPTPGDFAHSSWMSDDNRFLYVAEELSNGLITSYNVENIGNPVLLDRFRGSISQGSVPHNVHFLDEFLVVSHYRDGLMVIDAHRPRNLVRTGHYDTSFDLEGDGLNGCWGAYPYLPSGNILATDVENGLFVCTYDGSRAAYVEGVIRSEAEGNPVVFNACVMLVETGDETRVNLSGRYYLGTPGPDTITLEVLAFGYAPKTVTGIVLESGEVTIQDIFLTPWTTGIAEIEEEGFRFFPNPLPIGQPLQWENPDADQKGWMQILTLDGKIVHEEFLTGSQGVFSGTSHLAPGSYLLQWAQWGPSGAKAQSFPFQVH